MVKLSETERKSDAMAVQQAFASSGKVKIQILVTVVFTFCYCTILLYATLFNSPPTPQKSKSTLSSSSSQSYITEVIAASPYVDRSAPLLVFPQLQTAPRVLPLRVADMIKILVRFFCSVITFMKRLDTLVIAFASFFYGPHISTWGFTSLILMIS